MMNQDEAATAIEKKIAEIAAIAKTLPLRAKPRVPRNLTWLHVGFFKSDKSSETPGDCAGLEWTYVGSGAIRRSSLASVPIDRLARTFCALEEFESWVRRAIDGAERHQTEIERQAAHKIARLATYASFSPGLTKKK